MSASKYTPGPWQIAGPDHDTYKAGTILTNEYQVVCSVDEDCFIGEGEEMVDNETRANACLIATAPELFEALEHARKLLFYTMKEHGIYPDVGSMALIEDALKKAQGVK